MSSIVSIGDAVHDRIKQSQNAIIYGNVHSVFQRCAYLQFDAFLVCAGLSRLGASPISILFNREQVVLPKSIVVGANVSMSMERLQVSGHDTYTCQNDCVYGSTISPYQLIPTQIKAINHSVAKLDFPTQGLATLLKPDSNQSENSVLVDFVMPAIDVLTHSLSSLCLCTTDSQRTLVCPEPGQWMQLLGAGPGLTPSGDDFLSGVLTAMHVAGYKAAALKLWRCVHPIAHERTTSISIALLEQASSGRVSERTAQVLDALFECKGTKPARLHVLLSQLGETSGWDWLAGFVMGLNRLPEALNKPYSQAHSA